MNLVWNSTLEGPSKRFALLALADRASDEGEIAALGVPNLCRKTGISRSTMFRLLSELETQDGLIQRVQQYRGNQSRKASRFWINVPLLHASQRAGEDDRDQDDPVNPFTVYAGHHPVSNRDGVPSQIGTGPVPEQDPFLRLLRRHRIRIRTDGRPKPSRKIGTSLGARQRCGSGLAWI